MECVHRGSRRSCCAEYYLCRKHPGASAVLTVTEFVQLRAGVPIEERGRFDELVVCCETCEKRETGEAIAG